MVINWNLPASGEQPTPRKVRAAQYVRMSTEHQQYSTDNQAVAISSYAEAHGYEIVHTYKDDGKSGLNLAGRSGLKLLLADIEAGRTDFQALLVYDVSRLGRFQDVDEAATYELRIRAAGIQVEYCAEQFDNDGSISSSIIKTVKRGMAAEYSRELSVKVFAGQANLIQRGYRQGGAAGFGLRRLLVDVDGVPKGQLGRGEHKSIATDRVILVPGPPEEIAVIQDVYRLFTQEGRSEREIADDLNAQGLVTDLGRPWTRGTVHQLLINEKYVGDNVWARTSFKLKREHVQNAEAQWVRAEGAFTAVVGRDEFARARSIIDARSERLSDAAMLELLASIFTSKGMLTGLIIDEVESTPSSSAYRTRFGSLLRAYQLVGFVPDRDYRYVEINRQLRRLHPEIVAGTMNALEAVGATAARDPQTDLLTVNGEFTASLVVVRCVQTTAGSLRWKVRLDTLLKPDLTIAVRMAPDNEMPHDYYLLPRLDMVGAMLRLCEHNGLSLDAYRFDDLSVFHRLAASASLEGCSMSNARPAQRVEYIPLDRITVVNPRTRNKRTFKDITESIAQVGLKRPITVTRRVEADGPFYDLVCGQGRLEAYEALGQTEVPALVVSADPEDCLIASLVENCARRQHSAIDLLQDISGMRERGHSLSQIARKTGLTLEYVSGVSRLFEKGEERLLRSVEARAIPLTVAVEIAEVKEHDVQRALQLAYENGTLRGRKLLAAKRIVEERRRRGKQLRQPADKTQPTQKVSPAALIRAYQEDVDRKRAMIRRADAARDRLLLVTEALRRLTSSEQFTALIEDEELATMPENLALRLDRMRSGS